MPIFFVWDNRSGGKKLIENIVWDAFDDQYQLFRVLKSKNFWYWCWRYVMNTVKYKISKTKTKMRKFFRYPYNSQRSHRKWGWNCFPKHTHDCLISLNWVEVVLVRTFGSHKLSWRWKRLDVSFLFRHHNSRPLVAIPTNACFSK